MVKGKWLASLSDGTTLIEGEGELVGDHIGSPWFKLQEYLKKNGLHITGMRIQIQKDDEAVRTYIMPSVGHLNKEGKHIRWSFMRPLPIESYLAVRGAYGVIGHHNTMRATGDLYIRCQAEYEDFIVSMVVDLHEGTECTVVIHEKYKGKTA